MVGPVIVSSFLADYGIKLANIVIWTFILEVRPTTTADGLALSAAAIDLRDGLSDAEDVLRYQDLECSAKTCLTRVMPHARPLLKLWT